MTERPAPFRLPRLVVSAMSGGGGKTLLSLGLAGALRARGVEVVPFKKGPDYIDAAWLTAAAGRPASNLDPYFLSAERLRSLFVHACTRALPGACAGGQGGVALVEGNRGLYDGMDVEGSCATSQLARDLGAPVVLSLNATKMTRTAAALIQGITSFEKGLTFAGVVLGQVGRSRHASYLRASIERYTDMRVLGELPRLARNPLPERHMGISSLLGDRLSGDARQALESLAKLVGENVDVDAVMDAARGARPLENVAPFWPETADDGQPRPRIGYVRDEALWFYYRENLEALERAGARLTRLSLLDPAPWPFDGPDALDGLYLGGGFPEDYLDTLSGSPMLAELARRSAEGFPIYAECGGLMVLSRGISVAGRRWPMAGALPVEVEVTPRPQGLGYILCDVTGDNPYHPRGARLHGHEFHYSRVCGGDLEGTLLRLERGKGMGERRDALLAHATWGSYTHIFAPAVPTWAPAVVAMARAWRARRGA